MIHMKVIKITDFGVNKDYIMLELIEYINQNANTFNHLDSIIVVDKNNSCSRKTIIFGSDKDIYYIDDAAPFIYEGYAKNFLKEIRIHKLEELKSYKIFKYINFFDFERKALISDNDLTDTDIMNALCAFYNLKIDYDSEVFMIEESEIMPCQINKIYKDEFGRILADLKSKENENFCYRDGFYIRLYIEKGN